MGVYIKGMEMPHDCDSCKVSDILDCTLWKPMDIGERHPECPLVEVPTPHGDLIDRQKLLEDNKHLEYPTNEKYRRDRALAVGFNSGARHCNEHAVYAKTVIEAEDGT
jgi:hypothetical protein